MNRTGTALLGACALVTLPTAAAQARTEEAPGLAQTSDAGSPNLPIETSRPQLNPLAVIGQGGIYVWAPVAPAYNARADRNLAADPLWEAQGQGAPPGP
jgi:hypothetical protein